MQDPVAAHSHDFAGYFVRHAADGAGHRNRKRAIRSPGPCRYWWPGGFSCGHGIPCAGGVSHHSRQRSRSSGGTVGMTWRLMSLLGGLVVSALCFAQSTIILQNPSDAPLGSWAAPSNLLPRQAQQAQPAANALRLSVKDAEAIALRNNPAISVARLSALASQEVTREARSNLWPQAYASLTAVDARDNSRITAGELNNPVVFTRAAG